LQRHRLRWALAAAAFAATFAVGFMLAEGLAPERIRRETEARLALALGGPVSIGELRIAFGLTPRVRAEHLTAWPDAEGPHLRVAHLEANLSPIGLLIRRPLLGSLRFEGFELELERDARGRLGPEPLARLAAGRRESAAVPAADPWLAPVATLEAIAGAVLGDPRLAERIEVHDARVVFRDAAGGARRILALEGLEGRLRRFRVLGGTELLLRGRLLEAGEERGSFELLGSRGRDGGVELALAATALDLHALAPYLDPRLPPQPLFGTLNGYIGYHAPAPGQAELELDVVLSGLRSVIPPLEGGEPRPFEIERADLAGFLEISPRSVRLRDTRIANGRLTLEVAGQLSRPLGPDSQAQLSLALRELEVAELRDLLSWLPEVRREQAEQGLKRIEQGRLAHLQVGGSATLAAWQAFLSGRSRELPKRFSLEADVAQTRLRVGDTDHLDDLSGHLRWTGERLEVTGFRALRDGKPLPVIDLELDGAQNFLAGDPERRRLRPGGESLRGLGALIDVVSGNPEQHHPPVETRIHLDVDAIDHKWLLWPVDRLTAVIAVIPNGLRIEDLKATWAGVPVVADAVFGWKPEKTATVHMTASPPDGRPRESIGGAWARGRFEVEELATHVWSHEHGSGRFSTHAARFDFEDVEARLAPQGRAFGTASLDLAEKGSVPFRVSFKVEQGDVPSLAGQLGMSSHFATGTVDAAASLDGRLTPGVPISKQMSGLLWARAQKGEIRRVLPAVVAIALASRSFNPFTGREQIRYDQAETVLEFDGGVMHTDAFKLDGPDLRVFASGDLQLASEDHHVDANVVLFLFRQIDNVIEKIPVLNLLLLGTKENLLAAYFDLTGPWANPDATLVPLRSLATGPASLVLDGVPFLVRKSLEAIGALDADAGATPARPFSPEPAPPKRS
jgi:hypothetical protein